jgi:hypothetical protein
MSSGSIQDGHRARATNRAISGGAVPQKTEIFAIGNFLSCGHAVLPFVARELGQAARGVVVSN